MLALFYRAVNATRSVLRLRLAMADDRGMVIRRAGWVGVLGATLLAVGSWSGSGQAVTQQEYRQQEALQQAAMQQAASQQAARQTSTPYAGDLSIFETPGRDQRLQIDRVMTLLGITPGKSVADIGAGSGWFTVRAARRVGEGGTVFAEDINPQAIAAIEKRAVTEKLPNIRAVLGTPDDTRLAPASVDAVLLLKVYHEIAHPIPVMKQVRAALKPGAKVGIIDRNGSGADHGLDRAIVLKEMEAAGYRLTGKYDFTKADGQDYFLIFAAK